ncbi:MAG: hypothetical protein J5911_03245 [Clostridia bacterium]|nr:hypothetical protein [Clostridia bacterium]
MKKYCLIGEKLSHSYSAEIHGRAGLDYTLCEVKKEALKSFVDSGYDGFNITIPYKREIIPFLDEIDDGAKAIGAVNTAVKKGDKYYGYNTDLNGMRYALQRKGISVSDKNVMILGSGGTSDTAKALCEKDGARSVVKVSRSGEINYGNYGELKETEIVINATPVGTTPNIGVSPIDLSVLPNVKAVFDCVYNPFKTALIMQAEKLGIICSDGLPMLVKQAILAQELWGVKRERDETEEYIDALYKEKSDIVLIGMPSSGKTSVGKAVAEMLGKKFTDTDAEIYNETGKTPAEIIEKQGETAFRNIETAIVKRVAVNSGVVLATGGGAVIKEENICALKANGVICYIKRDLNLLSSDGRPLSKNLGICRLYEERKNLYEQAADFSVDNSGTIEVCANAVVRKFNEWQFNPKIKN